MRMMGADSVAYHEATVLGREDDFPGQALDYYASRGETPLVWGGDGAGRLRLVGRVTEAQYEAIYGPGGANDPTTGAPLATTRRPGMELVISAHKSVAELGVLGRAEDMHRIMDAERDATLSYLEAVTQERGGRRGRLRTPTTTSGLVYAHTRHATSRAGDPCPHDHVLVANVVEMLDAEGGWKAADTTLWREHLHAATIVGRVAAARAAVELGYAIEADHGPSGRLGHWRIAGIPDEVLEIHSKRAAEIDAAVRARGESSYRARNIAARDTRMVKRHTPVGELMPRWHHELAEVGWTVPELVASVERAAREVELARPVSERELLRLMGEALGPESRLSVAKVFTAADVVVAVGPALFGRPIEELSRVVRRVLATPEAVPLLGVIGTPERTYATAAVLATEAAVAELVSRGTGTTGAATLRQAFLLADDTITHQRGYSGLSRGTERNDVYVVGAPDEREDVRHVPEKEQDSLEQLAVTLARSEAKTMSLDELLADWVFRQDRPPPNRSELLTERHRLRTRIGPTPHPPFDELAAARNERQRVEARRTRATRERQAAERQIREFGSVSRLLHPRERKELEARLKRATNGEKGAQEILDRLWGHEQRLQDKVRDWSEWRQEHRSDLDRLTRQAAR